MQSMKKIEIVTATAKVKSLIASLEKLGHSGYTVINDIIGHGGRGDREGDQLSDVLKNSYIILICEPELVDATVEKIRPVLKRFGGLCLVSDVESVKH